MKLTNAQASTLIQVARHGHSAQKAQVSALVAKGLVMTGHDYERREWGKVVGSCVTASLTKKGEEFLSENEDRLKAQRAEYVNA